MNLVMEGTSEITRTKVSIYSAFTQFQWDLDLSHYRFWLYSGLSRYFQILGYILQQGFKTLRFKLYAKLSFTASHQLH